MNKREKILVTASVVAVIWGGVMTFGHKRSANMAESGGPEDTNRFIAAVAEKVKGDGSYDMNVRVLTTAMNNGIRSPFLARDVSIKGGNSEYTYSGYVENGKSIFAMINGNEYRTGDKVEGTECEIVSISTKRVILMENRTKRILPIEGGM